MLWVILFWPYCYFCYIVMCVWGPQSISESSISVFHGISLCQDCYFNWCPLLNGFGVRDYLIHFTCLFLVAFVPLQQVLVLGLPFIFQDLLAFSSFCTSSGMDNLVWRAYHRQWCATLIAYRLCDGIFCCCCCCLLWYKLFTYQKTNIINVFYWRVEIKAIKYFCHKCLRIRLSYVLLFMSISINISISIGHKSEMGNPKNQFSSMLCTWFEWCDMPRQKTKPLSIRTKSKQWKVVNLGATTRSQ